MTLYCSTSLFSSAFSSNCLFCSLMPPLFSLSHQALHPICSLWRFQVPSPSLPPPLFISLITFPEHHSASSLSLRKRIFFWVKLMTANLFFLLHCHGRITVYLPQSAGSIASSCCRAAGLSSTFNNSNYSTQWCGRSLRGSDAVQDYCGCFRHEKNFQRNANQVNWARLVRC